ncbi:MAG: hypothetical protein IFK93_05125 [Acidobacteria bacterium]|nr:hypothetical protein [Candidatus Sulfomarinibacter kjeldsenii]MBD3855371.1 hypothetical protein [Candidatus Sulfomarinibacter kjeldsenii]
MLIRKTLSVLFVLLISAGIAAADLKVIKQTHQDGFTIMGQTQPAEDKQQTTWIGTNMMYMDQGDNVTIVRLDTMKLYVVDHTTKTYHVLDLPVDLSTLVPPEMQPMLAMMQFEVTVTPTDEHKQVGEWDARRYDMSMTSQMFSMKSTMWVTKVAGYDPEAFNSMYVHLNSLQPGMADAVKEMGKIDGLVVEQQGLMTMMGNEVGTSEKTISIDNIDAPAGTYDPPAGYTEKPFDFMARMQR